MTAVEDAELNPEVLESMPMDVAMDEELGQFLEYIFNIDQVYVCAAMRWRWCARIAKKAK